MPTVIVRFSADPSCYGQSRLVISHAAAEYRSVQHPSDIAVDMEYPRAVEAFHLKPGDYSLRWWARGALAVHKKFSLCSDILDLSITIHEDSLYAVNEDEVFLAKIEQSRRGEK